MNIFEQFNHVWTEIMKVNKDIPESETKEPEIDDIEAKENI